MTKQTWSIKDSSYGKDILLNKNQEWLVFKQWERKPTLRYMHIFHLTNWKTKWFVRNLTNSLFTWYNFFVLFDFSGNLRLCYPIYLGSFYKPLPCKKGMFLCTFQLKEIVAIVDGILEEFSLPAFYKDPSFHASIAWLLGDLCSEKTEEVQTKLQGILDACVCEKEVAKSLVLEVKEVHCNIGNKRFVFPLDATWLEQVRIREHNPKVNCCWQRRSL